MKLNGSIEKFANGCIYAVNGKPTKPYQEALKYTLLTKTKECQEVQSELIKAQWAPIRDYRSGYIPNRVPSAEDIFGYCDREGNVQMNDMHQFKTEKGYAKLSPFLQECLMKRMKSHSE